ncbi:hypothetical protein NPIL_16741 [Nephila pilipes]|uniref:Large ribosomal subunit protein uL18 C-terminal eukaryotes domain-containing protein n=1 Tax=Nephila pilipes TaxID=299642 RepID=A0A8X6ND19_NEPPI|nr:hypothetical protein NPIL_16741 [Nephila pilipes]
MPPKIVCDLLVPVQFYLVPYNPGDGHSVIISDLQIGHLLVSRIPILFRRSPRQSWPVINLKWATVSFLSLKLADPEHKHKPEKTIVKKRWNRGKMNLKERRNRMKQKKEIIIKKLDAEKAE